MHGHAVARPRTRPRGDRADRVPARRRACRDAARASRRPTNTARAVHRFDAKLGLEQPGLVLVHLRRGLLVDEEQAHQPRAVASRRASSQPHARRLVQIEVLRLEQAVAKRQDHFAADRLTLPDLLLVVGMIAPCDSGPTPRGLATRRPRGRPRRSSRTTKRTAPASPPHRRPPPGPRATSSPSTAARSCRAASYATVPRGASMPAR